MISLTDSQLSQLKAAAALLPEQRRSSFLSNVGAALVGTDVTNDTLSAAIRLALGNFGVAVGGTGYTFRRKEPAHEPPLQHRRFR